MLGKKYSLAELKALPTLQQSHTDNLKKDTGNERIWLSRMTVGDGMHYNNQVTVEVYTNGKWNTVDTYQAQ
ncbi:hypothetical protein H1230_30100 [Paenibacillus sp. 19GGS1-52]|uniref:hypothetical protein n=1 Tax=Paenibacillus sp. 19GGS1-52 TaxID=2758563 RepID=UPI001EFAC6F3|nr:hypothetical protein [Paenibacillus sp. 19GGS1-52]ULO07141.1 hypothetical protein H1230_30100 [Paenibacillus sp. 19GGS1-52]